MRNPSRQRQIVYTSKKSTQGSGFNKKEVYTAPERWFLPVSATSGTPDEISAGIVPTYERYITSYDKNFKKQAVEGECLWIDRVPQLEEDGTLSLNEDGTPVTPPDYVIVKIISTLRSVVDRYGISKIGGN